MNINNPLTTSYEYKSRFYTMINAFMILHICVLLAAIWSCWMEIQLLKRIAKKENLNEATLQLNDLRQAAIGMAQSIVFITLGILILRWIMQANRNCRALGESKMEFTPGWSIGWYFIPIASFFKPYQAMREIWVSSSHKPQGMREKSSHLLRLWWGFFLVSQIVGNISFRLSLREPSSMDFSILQSYAMFWSDIIDIPNAIVALLLIREIHARQTAKYNKYFQIA